MMFIVIYFQIVAHEIGHNLGMQHDFKNENTTHKRYSLIGELCTGIGGYMDYQPNPNKWSNCSVEDFRNYFSSVDACLGKYTNVKFAFGI